MWLSIIRNVSQRPYFILENLKIIQNMEKGKECYMSFFKKKRLYYLLDRERA